MPRESEIQSEILLAYGAREGLRIWRSAVGVAQIKGRWVRFGGPNGHPDIAGVIRPGRPVYIEVKSPKGKPTPEQLAFGRMIQEHGGIWILARSIRDVSAVLDPLLEEANG